MNEYPSAPENAETASDRTSLLIGDGGVKKLKNSFVTVVGLGGVGGHCAEALARAGIGTLCLVDTDIVRISNLNRQAVATKKTIGMKKTEAMAARIREISDCETIQRELFVTPETVEQAIPPETDFIVDAIDYLPGKIALAELSVKRNVPIISCMGAGNRLDPTEFRIRDIFSTSGCPLARAMRHELRKRGIQRLPVVFSEEPATRAPGQTVIGSIAPVPAAAGLAAAAYVIQSLLKEASL